MGDYQEQRRNHILLGRPLAPKKTYNLRPKSEKLLAKEKAEKELRGDGDTEKQAFFKRCIKRMLGSCRETGLPTETRNYAYAIRSICHILPQESCDSVKYHPANWIEFDKDFHVKFDAMSWQEREQLKCWPEIRDKLIMVWEDLAPEEQRHFPESVLLYMQEKSPFTQ